MWHVYGEQANSPMNDFVEKFNATVGKEKGIVIDVTLMSNAAQIGKTLEVLVDGYDEEERTAHVHESGSDRHAAPRAVVRTAKRTGTAAWSLITAALFLLLPALYLLLQRSTSTPVPEPPLPAEEQATAAYSNAYDDLRGTVPAAGADWDGDLTAGLYTVGQDLPEGTYTIQCAEGNTSIDLHIVSDAYGVEIYEDLSANGYDAIDSERDDVPLPTGTVLFLSGNGTLYFHSSNAQVDALPTETAPNPLVGDAAYTLGDSDESLYLLVGEDIEPGVYDVTCTAGTGYFSFVLPMENTRTMYCSAWLYGDPDYVDTLRHITLTEDTEVTLSNYSDMDFTVTLTPSETVYVHE